MPSLSEKLKALGVHVGASSIKPVKHNPSISNLTDSLDGSWEETSRGDCFVVHKYYPHAFLHGNRTLNQKPLLSIFDKLDALSGITDIPLEHCLFIDTETTGLSGGAGTYVFLVGAGKFDQNGIHFAQFFLQDPSNEPSQLAALEQFSAETKILISYNGKSFDLPRIKTRYLFHGWPAPFEDLLHIDLLHIVRRLWKDHLPACSLGDIETHLLGVKRSSIDIPGWQVSEKFFLYLQDNDPAPLKSVFYHNEIDVISLVTLLSYITDRLSNPLAKYNSPTDDLVSIGKYLILLNHKDAGAKVLTRAVNLKEISSLNRISGLNALAAHYKKENKFDLAIPLWKESAGLYNYESKIELAKYYEHRKRDYQEAIHWTLSALEFISQRSHNLVENPNTLSLNHRLNRLKIKTAKASLNKK